MFQIRHWIMWIVIVAASASLAMAKENLGRGIIGTVQSDQGVFVSWRLLNTDPDAVAFNLYRSTDGKAPQRLNDQPISTVTWFLDAHPDLSQSNQYTVRAVVDGKEAEPSGPFTLPAGATPRPYHSVALQTPEGYSPNDCSVGDLDGDGELEIIVHQTGKGHDNSHSGLTDPPILQAYKLDGTLLWTINLGKNIREGAHYTQFMVYDLDGDAKAELVCKTADGTVDGRGKVIGKADADYVNQSGYILSGPEYLTVFNGQTGAAMATVDYVPPRYPDTLEPSRDQLKKMWGDNYGNRVDRFLACVAYLDGEHPSVVMCRGYYTRTVLAAWDWRDGKLTQRWVFDSNTPGNEKYAGQGNHNLSVADVDGDGRDEIIYGSMTIDDDGKGLYTTGLGHGDALHVGDLDPTRPGLEVWMPHEGGATGATFRDAATGEILFKFMLPKDVGRACAADIDPRYPGVEVWASNGCPLYSAKGEVIATDYRLPINFAVWWDGDGLRELLDGTTISKWNWKTQKIEVLLNAKEYDCRSNNGTKATPALSGDLYGDWREEVILPTVDGKELRIFTTTIPTHRRIVTLLQDRQYREAIAWQNVAYNQPPHPSFYIGPDKQDMIDFGLQSEK